MTQFLKSDLISLTQFLNTGPISHLLPPTLPPLGGRHGEDPDGISLGGTTSDDDDDSSLYERLEHQAELPAFEHSRGLADDEGSVGGVEGAGGGEGERGSTRPTDEQMVKEFEGFRYLSSFYEIFN